jgi:hypothetical protein
VDLIVVDDINVTHDEATGEIHTHGGRLRVWSDWSPNDEGLKPLKSACSLPTDPKSR